MLILTRRPGESINIGDDTEVTILGIQGTQVRVGIKAPKQVSVHRKEIYQRIRAANQEASQVTSSQTTPKIKESCSV